MYWILFIIVQGLWLYLIRRKRWLLLWVGLYAFEALCASWAIAEFLSVNSAKWNGYFVASILFLILILTTAIVHVCCRKDN